MKRKWKMLTGLLIVSMLLAACTPGSSSDGNAPKEDTEKEEK